MKNKLYFNLIVVGLSTIFILFKCNEYKDPNMINEPTMEYADAPTITTIIPSGNAVAGVRTITIQGQNFELEGGNDTTLVYIDGELAKKKSLSENEVVVYRPAKYGDNLAIRVEVPNAISIAKYDGYKIEEPLVKFGDFSREAYELSSFAVAENDDIFFASHRKILHLTSDGINLTSIAYLSSRLTNVTDMKFGPGGFLYMLTGRKIMYRLKPVLGVLDSVYADSVIQYAEFSKNATFFDFDQKSNIYFGSRDGIWTLRADTIETFTGYHDDDPITGVRIYNNYLYVSTADKLSRNQILDNNGNLGSTELIIDVKSQTGFGSADISSFEIDSQGMIIFCLKNIKNKSLFVFEDGTLNLYYQAKIIPANIDQIGFGRDNYMYLNRSITLNTVDDRDSLKIFKMGMQYVGAPYYGRE